jgi:septum formation inhibitor MinC
MKSNKGLIAGAAMAGLLGGTTARVHAAQTSPTKTSITTNAGVLAADENPSKHDCKGKGGCNGKG